MSPRLGPSRRRQGYAAPTRRRGPAVRWTGLRRRALQNLHPDRRRRRPRDGAGLRGFVFSPIATNWWTRYESAGWHEFDGVSVVDVHRDGPYGVNPFLRSDDRPFAVFADVEGSIADRYDLRIRREGMGEATTARRAIFVVDGAGTVVYARVADDRISPAPRREVEAAVDGL